MRVQLRRLQRLKFLIYEYLTFLGVRKNLIYKRNEIFQSNFPYLIAQSYFEAEEHIPMQIKNQILKHLNRPRCFKLNAMFQTSMAAISVRKKSNNMALLPEFVSLSAHTV